MAAVRPDKTVRLFVAVLSAPTADLAAARAMVEERFGPADSNAGPWPHVWTDYYAGQMGPGLLRSFWGFARPMIPDDLVDAKLAANALEARFAGEFPVPGSARPINLDPGYVCDGKVVLASVKDHCHRLCMGRGVYAECTLHWQAGAWRDWPWTYPDYRTDEYKAFFADQRSRLRSARRGV
jgi:hypothetical protein